MSDEVEAKEEAFRLFGRLMTLMDPGRLEAWADLGLTMTQLRVLFHLRVDEGLTAGCLADRLDVSPSALTRIMDRLVRNSLVRREAGGDDRRVVLHYLTDRGRQTIEEIERSARASMYRWFGQLEPHQLERLVLALRDLLAASGVLAPEPARRAEVA